MLVAPRSAIGFCVADELDNLAFPQNPGLCLVAVPGFCVCGADLRSAGGGIFSVQLASI
nr:hypothetical protein [uncultured Roseateles sp.]